MRPFQGAARRPGAAVQGIERQAHADIDVLIRDSPYSTFTSQCARFDPAAGIIVLLTLLITLLPTRPSAGTRRELAASYGAQGLPISFADTGDAINTAPTTSAVDHHSARFAIVTISAGRIVLIVVPFVGRLI